MGDLGLSVKITGDGKDLKAEIKGLKGNLDGFAGKAESSSKRADKAFSKTRRGVESISKQLRNMQGIAAGAFAFAGISSATGSLTSMSDTFVSVNARLQLTAKSTAELALAQAKLARITRDSRGDWKITVDLYSRMAMATQDLGLKQSTLLGVTESINQAIVVSGASNIEASAALTQLGQGLASGTLRGEELNSVLEQTPRIARMIADGAGIAFGDLRKVASEGKLTADVVIKALQNQAGVVNKEFKTMPATIAQSTLQVRNSFTQLWGDFTTTSGAAKGLSDTILFLADNLKAMLGGALVAGKVILMGYTAKLVLSTVATIASSSAVASLRLASLGLFMLYKSGGIAALLSAPFTGISTSAKEATKSIGKLKLATGILTAAFAGWQIGTYLSEEFSVVRKAGISLAAGLANVWENVKYGVQVMGAGIVAAYEGFINTIKASFGGMVVMVSDGLKALGMGGETTANMDAFVAALDMGASATDKLTKRVKALGDAKDEALKLNDNIYGQMFAEAGEEKPKASNIIRPDFSAPKAVIETGETDDEKAARLAKDKEETDNIINLAQAKFNRLALVETTAIMAEEGRINARYAAKLESLEVEKETLIANKAWTAENVAMFAEAEKALEQQKQDDINAIKKKGMDAYQKLSIASGQSQVKTSLDLMESLTAGAASESRAMFEINKTASLASATVSGVEAVQHSYKTGAAVGGPILGAAFAGVAVVATLANLKKIQSTSFGGGGEAGSAGGASVPDASNTPSANDANLPTGETQSATQAPAPTPIYLSVDMRGTIASQDYLDGKVTDLVKRVAPDATKDRIENDNFVLMPKGSANADLLTGT